MTVPLLHFVYFRKMIKEAKQTNPDIYTVFLNVSNMGTAHFLVTVSSLFNNMKENIRVKALFLVEITDRPSSYFFSEYYNMVQDRGFTKDGKKRKNLLSDMKHNAKLLGTLPLIIILFFFIYFFLFFIFYFLLLLFYYFIILFLFYYFYFYYLLFLFYCFIIYLFSNYLFINYCFFLHIIITFYLYLILF